MVDVYEPVECVRIPRPGRALAPLWRVRYAKPSGGFLAHVFPRHIFAARAAEYGIDPADVDTLITMVLHEPFIRPDDPERHADVYAVTVAQARALHGRRIARAKAAVQVDHTHPVLAPLHEQHGVTQDLVDAYAQQVARYRLEGRLRAARTAPPDPARPEGITVRRRPQAPVYHRPRLAPGGGTGG